MLPASASTHRWQINTATDADKGGNSAITVQNSKLQLNYNYVLSDQINYPSVATILKFTPSNASYVDFSDYTELSLKLKCEPRNTLSVHLHSLDPAITDPSMFASYRIAESFVSCNENWSQVSIDLDALHVPNWWLNWFNLNVADKSYDLSKVLAFSIVASRLGPKNIPARVNIDTITLRGKDSRFILAFALFAFLTWPASAAIILNGYGHALTEELEKKMTQGRSLVAYKQLSTQPHKDGSDLGRVLQFMATEYNNPQMNLDFATGKLGINRNTLNAILKQELGLTFAVYLNKLRLVEAARILEQEEHVTVSELAYHLGYHSVAYFCKLFKQEYGCTPKKFNAIQKQANNP
ncbi:MAG: AraC family transcriptional regulator [Cellvibrionaceae bacterium]|nr:AraC family transcriptional regulator [Cellvibrionaceae bacterium]